MGDQGTEPKLVVGLDVGTKATKCLVCDREGRVVAQSHRDYALQHPQEGWVEQAPEDLWQAVVEALREAVARSKSVGQIGALSLSSQGGTTIPVDGEGQPLRAAISWLDSRAAAEGKHLVAEVGQERIYDTTGWEVGTGLPLLHIPWLKHHERQTYDQVGRYLFVNDFVLSRLAGRLCMDPSDAALTMLYNIESGTWDERLCQAAGARSEQLSQIVDSGRPVGRVLPGIAAQVGLPEGVVVVNGGHDQYCAALGAGVIGQGQVLLSCGTAWVVLATADRLLRDPQHTFSPGRHVVPGMWGLLCSMPAAGATMDWLVRNILSEPSEAQPGYDLLDERIADPSPGARGLLFLPFLSGIEAATRRTGLWGTLTGLTLGHTRWDIAQSLMEGVALELCWILESLRTLGYEPQVLHMVGGATRSRAWPQVVADVTGVPLAVPEVTEAAARGAALLAAVGAGLCRDLEEAVPIWRCQTRSILPRPENAEAYGELFERFKAVDGALRQALVEQEGSRKEWPL